MRRNTFIKRVSIVLLTAFLCQDVVQAGALEVRPTTDLASNPSLLRLASSYAEIHEIHKGTRPRLLIHIQDAHTNVSGQENLARTIEELVTRYNVKTVFVEGGAGNNTLAFLRPLAPANIRKQIAKKYLMKGELNGEEYLSLASNHDFELWGVEERSLYEQNLKEYGDVFKKREEVLSYIESIRKCVQTLKRRLYGKDVVAFDEAVEKFERKEKDFTEYHALLAETAVKNGISMEAFPNFVSLSDLKSKEEKIDFEAANREQTELVHASLAGAEASEAVTSKLEKIHASTQPALSFYDSLIEAAQKKSIPEESYRNLRLYADYLKAYSRVDMAAFLNEMQRLQEEIYSRSLKDPNAVYLHAIDAHVKVLRTLFSLQASKEIYETYLTRKADPRFDTVVFLAFLNRKLYDLGNTADVVRYQPLLDQSASRVESFYGTTERRDEAFVKKAFLKMDAENTSVAVIVTGGYHTFNLTRLLKSSGVSYAVVTPIVTQETNLKRYEEILLAQLGAGNPILKKFVSRAGERATALRFTAVERQRHLAAGQEGPLEPIAMELAAAGGTTNTILPGLKLFLPTDEAGLPSPVGGPARIALPGTPSLATAATRLATAARPKYAANLYEGVGERTPDWERLNVVAALFLIAPGDTLPLSTILKNGKQALDNKRLPDTEANIQNVHLKKLVDLELVQATTDGSYKLLVSKRLLAVKMAGAEFIHYDIKQLVNAVKDPANQANRPAAEEALRQTMKEYSGITGIWHLAPTEARWPVLQAISYLSAEDQALLVSLLDNSPAELRNRTLIDSILLMLQEEPPADWLERNAPNLVGKTIYYVSPEIWLVAGGLGRVSQYHSIGMKKLVGNKATVATIEPFYPKRVNHEGKLEDFDYKDLQVPVTGLTKIPVRTFTVRVGRNDVEAQIFKGTNEHGMDIYLIKDAQGIYTAQLYRYGSDFGTASWAEFSEFFSKASLQLMQILEAEKQAEATKQGTTYNSPVIIPNDGQLGLLPELKREADESGDPARNTLKGAFISYVTHTVNNRNGGMGEDQLRSAGILQKMWQYFMRLGKQVDPTSAGRRTADMTTHVAVVHGGYVNGIANNLDPGVKGIAVTNGADRRSLYSVFIATLKQLFQGVDPERPSNTQVADTKYQAKILASSNASLIKLNPLIAKIKPWQMLLGYFGRLVSEKAGRNRAFTDDNIRAMVEEGTNVLLAANVQSHTQAMQDRLTELARRLNVYEPLIQQRLVKGMQDWDALGPDERMRRIQDLERKLVGGENPDQTRYIAGQQLGLKAQRDIIDLMSKAGLLEKNTDEAMASLEGPNGFFEKNKRGYFIPMTGWSQPEQIAMLAAADVQVQDSDIGTEAAGYTESTIIGIQVGPPGLEGVLQKNSLVIDESRHGWGSVMVPLGEHPDYYRDVFTRLNRLFKADKDGNSPDFGKFSSYQAASIPLNRMLDAKLPSADYLREISLGIGSQQNPLQTLEDSMNGNGWAESRTYSEWYRKALVAKYDELAARDGSNVYKFKNTRSPDLHVYAVEIGGKTRIVNIDVGIRNNSNAETGGYLSDPGLFKTILDRIGLNDTDSLNVSENGVVYGASRTGKDLRENGLPIYVRGSGVQVLDLAGSRLTPSKELYTDYEAAAKILATRPYVAVASVGGAVDNQRMFLRRDGVNSDEPEAALLERFREILVAALTAPDSKFTPVAGNPDLYAVAQGEPLAPAPPNPLFVGTRLAAQIPAEIADAFDALREAYTNAIPTGDIAPLLGDLRKFLDQSNYVSVLEVRDDLNGIGITSGVAADKAVQEANQRFDQAIIAFIKREEFITAQMDAVKRVVRANAPPALATEMSADIDRYRREGEFGAIWDALKEVRSYIPPKSDEQGYFDVALFNLGLSITELLKNTLQAHSVAVRAEMVKTITNDRIQHPDKPKSMLLPDARIMEPSRPEKRVVLFESSVPLLSNPAPAVAMAGANIVSAASEAEAEEIAKRDLDVLFVEGRGGLSRRGAIYVNHRKWTQSLGWIDLGDLRLAQQAKAAGNFHGAFFIYVESYFSHSKVEESMTNARTDMSPFAGVTRVRSTVTPILKARDGSLYKPYSPDGLGVASHFDLILQPLLEGVFGDALARATERGQRETVYASTLNMNGLLSVPSAAIVGDFHRRRMQARDAGRPVPFVAAQLAPLNGEKGGIFANVQRAAAEPEPMIVEGFLISKPRLAQINQNPDRYPGFNTNHVDVSVSGLVDFFFPPGNKYGITDKDLTSEALRDPEIFERVLAAANDRFVPIGSVENYLAADFTQQIPTFIETKALVERDDFGVETREVVDQISTMLNALVTLGPGALYYFSPRDIIEEGIEKRNYAEYKVQNQNDLLSLIKTLSDKLAALNKQLDAAQKAEPKDDAAVAQLHGQVAQVEAALSEANEAYRLDPRGNFEKVTDIFAAHGLLALLPDRRGREGASKDKLIREVLYRSEDKPGTARVILNASSENSATIHVPADLYSLGHTLWNTLPASSAYGNIRVTRDGDSVRIEIDTLERLNFRGAPVQRVYAQENNPAHTIQLINQLNDAEYARLSSKLQQAQIPLAFEGLGGVYIDGSINIRQFREWLAADGYTDVVWSHRSMGGAAFGPTLNIERVGGQQIVEMRGTRLPSAVKADTLAAFFSQRAEVGFHTFTGGKGHTGVDPATLAALALESIKNGFVPALDDLKALQLLREKDKTSPVAFFITPQTAQELRTTVEEAARQAVENGAHAIFTEPSILEAVVRTARNLNPEIVVFSEVAIEDVAQQRLAGDVIEQAVLDQVMNGADGVILKPYFRGPNNIIDATELAEIGNALPDVLFMVAGGVFQGRVNALLSALPSNMFAALGVNQTTVPGLTAQLREYKVNLPSAQILQEYADSAKNLAENPQGVADIRLSEALANERQRLQQRQITSDLSADQLLEQYATILRTALEASASKFASAPNDADLYVYQAAPVGVRLPSAQILQEYADSAKNVAENPQGFPEIRISDALANERQRLDQRQIRSDLSAGQLLERYADILRTALQAPASKFAAAPGDADLFVRRAAPAADDARTIGTRLAAEAPAPALGQTFTYSVSTALGADVFSEPIYIFRTTSTITGKITVTGDTLDMTKRGGYSRTLGTSDVSDDMFLTGPDLFEPVTLDRNALAEVRAQSPKLSLPDVIVTEPGITESSQTVSTALSAPTTTRGIIESAVADAPHLSGIPFFDPRNSKFLNALQERNIHREIAQSGPGSPFVVAVPFKAYFDLKRGYPITGDLLEGTREVISQLERSGSFASSNQIVISFVHRGDPLDSEASSRANAELQATQLALGYGSRVQFKLITIPATQKLADGITDALGKSIKPTGLAIAYDFDEGIQSVGEASDLTAENLASKHVYLSAVKLPGENQAVSFAGTLSVSFMRVDAKFTIPEGLGITRSPVMDKDGKVGFYIWLVNPTPVVNTELQAFLLSKRSTDSSA